METIKIRDYAPSTLFSGALVTKADGQTHTTSTDGWASDGWTTFTSTAYGSGPDNPRTPTGLLEALCDEVTLPQSGGSVTGCDCHKPGGSKYVASTATSPGSFECAGSPACTAEPCTGEPVRRTETRAPAAGSFSQEECADQSMTTYAKCKQAQKSVSATWLVRLLPAPPPSYGPPPSPPPPPRPSLPAPPPLPTRAPTHCRAHQAGDGAL